jgi:nicotinamide-nucleotide amidase
MNPVTPYPECLRERKRDFIHQQQERSNGVKAEIINTGTELFLNELTNVNLSYLSNQLIKIGWEPIFHTTVPDNIDHLVTSIHTALKRVRLVIITGGLGPTADDLTRFAVAVATKRELSFNKSAYKTVQSFFKKLGRPIAPLNRIQAEIPKGAKVLPNNIGTAPGFLIKINDKTIVALPGVPLEMKDMFKRHLIPMLNKNANKQRLAISPKYILFGITESHLQDIINKLELPSEITVSMTFANNGVISLRFIVKGKTPLENELLLSSTENIIKASLGKLIFGQDDDTLEGVVADMLIKNKISLGLAESCTGGLICHHLTNVPGISKSLREGLVCYSDESKIKRLGIPRQLIKKYGAVSPEVAKLMARNITRQEKTDLGLGITGIAGPSGGTKTKPVGLVYIALHSRNSRMAVPRHSRASKRRMADEVLKYQFNGPRIMVKERASATALNLIRLRLLEL